MIVDVHTRIWDSSEQLGPAVAEQLRRSRRASWRRPDASPPAHEAAMEPVQAAFVLGMHSEFLGAHITHQQVADYVGQAPDKCLGFAGIDPTVEDVEESLIEARGLGLVGVTMSPAAQGFNPTATPAMSVYEACEATGMPVFLETGSSTARQAKMEFAQPFLLDEVARSFPDLKLVLSSMGSPFIEQGLALITKHPHVFADLSELILQPWQLYNTLVLCHQHGVSDQLLFGSNFPFCTPEKAIVTMYSVNTLTHGTNLPTVPREMLRSIVERDTLDLLGLNRPNGETAAPTPEEQVAGRPITVVRESVRESE